MGKLLSVVKGKRAKPPRILIYGPEGIGKTSFAAGAPGAIFIETEDGSDSLDVARFPEKARHFRDVLESLRELRDGEHDFRTVVIDSMDGLESLIHKWILESDGAETMAKACGGYGAAYREVAPQHWATVCGALDQLRERGMGSILVAHAGVYPVKDPETPEYDNHRPRLHKDSEPLLREWADVVGFATRRIVQKVAKDADGTEKFIPINAGQSGAERILRLSGAPTFVAKNRYGLPHEIPLSWDAFAAAFSKATAAPVPALAANPS